MPEQLELPPRAGAMALAAVLFVDGLVLPQLPSRPLAGIVDELAHLATGTVVLAAWPTPEPEFAAGLAAGSVLIDVDHLPELWGRTWLRPRGVRPLPHSLITPALTTWRARRTKGRFARGAAVGLTAHLLRDLATGTTGVALAWPLTARPFSIRYRTYFAALAVLAGIGAAGARAESGRVWTNSGARVTVTRPPHPAGSQGTASPGHDGPAGGRKDTTT